MPSRTSRKNYKKALGIDTFETICGYRRSLVGEVPAGANHTCRLRIGLLGFLRTASPNKTELTMKGPIEPI